MATSHVLWKRSPAIIGMIHVGALPGTPHHSLSMEEICEKACREADVYQRCHLDAVLVENMHDTPYLHTDNVGHEVTAAMTAVCHRVRHTFSNGPVGVQILAGANRQAMAVAKAVGLQFIRAEGFVFSHIADEGLMNACAGDLLRYRKMISAEDVKILADIKKKHSSHSITADVNINETAKAAEFFHCDGVVITGSSTGQEADTEEVKGVSEGVSVPVLVGSGVTTENVDKFLSASGLIIGSHFKKGGYWMNDLDESVILRFIDKVQKLRSETKP